MNTALMNMSRPNMHLSIHEFKMVPEVTRDACHEISAVRIVFFSFRI